MRGNYTSYGFCSKPTITRTADVVAYTAGDVIGAATGATAAIELKDIGPQFGVIRVTNVDLRIDVAAIPSGMTNFRLHLYNVTPPSALGDNVAWDLPAGDRASYLGYIDLGSPVDLGATLFVQSGFIDKEFLMGANASLYGYLTTTGAYTPASATVHAIRVYSVSL